MRILNNRNSFLHFRRWISNIRKWIVKIRKCCRYRSPYIGPTVQSQARHYNDMWSLIYASFSKRTPMTVYVSNKQVNNTLIAYIYQRVYIRLPTGVVVALTAWLWRHGSPEGWQNTLEGGMTEHWCRTSVSTEGWVGTLCSCFGICSYKTCLVRHVSSAHLAPGQTEGWQRQQFVGQ